MANLEKKLDRFGLNGKVYRSKKTNKNSGYEHSYGLKTSDEAKQVLGEDGVFNVGSDVRTNVNKTKAKLGFTEGSQINQKRELANGEKVDGLAISTGGGDPLPKGSKDNEFLVAENAEEQSHGVENEFPVPQQGNGAQHHQGQQGEGVQPHHIP